MPTYEARGKDVLLNGKIIATASTEQQAVVMAQRAQSSQPRTLESLGISAPISFPSAGGAAQGLAQNVPTATGQSQSQLFSQSLQGLLQQYQQLGTRPFAEQGLAAQEEQVRRLGAQTPQELIGASPAIQGQVRTAATGAVEPTITGAHQAEQTFTEQIKSFGDTLGIARNLIKDFESAEAQKRDDARISINQALTVVGGSAFEGLDPNEVIQLEKIAGYPKGYLAGITKTLRERELELKKQEKEKKLQFVSGTNNQVSGVFDPTTGAFTPTRGGGGGRGTDGEIEPSGKLSPRAKAVYDNPALLTNYTPTERGRILDEISRGGFDTTRFSIPTVNAAQRDQIALFDEIEQEALRGAELYRKGIDTGPIASRIKRFGAAVGFAPAFTDLRSVIDNMGSILLRMRSGAAVTPQEFDRIRGFIPQLNEDEKTASRKITRFFDAINQAKTNYIERATQTSFQIQQQLQTGFGQQSSKPPQMRLPNGTIVNLQPDGTYQ